jgi:hypothetical protein
VNPASLPDGAEDLCDGGLEAFVCVGDHELGAAQTTRRQAAQELDPERFGLAVPGGHAEHVSPAVGVHAHRYNDGDGDDLMVTADFDLGGVEPDIRPVTFDRPRQEGVHVHIDLERYPN